MNNIKGIVIISLLIISTLTFNFCSEQESMIIKPKLNSINELVINITDEYERFEIAEVNIKNKSESTINVKVIEINESETLLKGMITDYGAESNFRGRKEVSVYSKLKDVEFDFSVDGEGNISTKNIDTSKSKQSNISKKFIQKALEQTFNLLLKGYSNREMKLKDYWKTTVEMPIIMKSGPDAIVKYSITYKFDRVDQTGVIDLLLDGTAEIIAENLEKSIGNVKGLIKFNLIKGFPEKLEFEENYKIDPISQDLSEIIIEKKKTLEIEIN